MINWLRKIDLKKLIYVGGILLPSAVVLYSIKKGTVETDESVPEFTTVLPTFEETPEETIQRISAPVSVPETTTVSTTVPQISTPEWLNFPFAASISQNQYPDIEKLPSTQTVSWKSADEQIQESLSNVNKGLTFVVYYSNIYVLATISDVSGKTITVPVNITFSEIMDMIQLFMEIGEEIGEQNNKVFTLRITSFCDTGGYFMSYNILSKIYKEIISIQNAIDTVNSNYNISKTLQITTNDNWIHNKIPKLYNKDGSVFSLPEAPILLEIFVNKDSIVFKYKGRKKIVSQENIQNAIKEIISIEPIIIQANYNYQNLSDINSWDYEIVKGKEVLIEDEIISISMTDLGTKIDYQQYRYENNDLRTRTSLVAIMYEKGLLG